MAKSQNRKQYDFPNAPLQIQQDLKGAILLGQMQLDLLKSVEASLQSLSLSQKTTGLRDQKGGRA